jgi:CRISPR-associated protein (TIGR02710 family)
MDLEGAKRAWHDLLAGGKSQEAQTFYQSSVFPAVMKRFQAKHPPGWSLPPVYGLILQVGSSPEPLILVILALRPEKVFFLYTREFEHNVDVILDATGLKAGKVSSWGKVLEPLDSSDVTGIYRAIKNQVAAWRRDDSSRRIVVDISGGKKSMVGGAATAAAMLNIEVSYVDNDDYNAELRKPEPGAEYLRFLPNPFITLGDAKRALGVSYFNDHNYVRARDTFDAVLQELYGPEAAGLVPQYTLYRDLANAYDAWDNFDFVRAEEILSQVLKRNSQALSPGLDGARLARQCEVLRVLARNQETEARLRNSRMQDLRDFRPTIAKEFFRLMRETAFAEELVLTLMASADRLADRGKFTDAVMRLYRVLELVGQIRLAVHGINSSDTNNPQPAREMLAAMNAIYARANRRPPFDLSREPLRLPPFGVYQDYVALYVLDDQVWLDGGRKPAEAELARFDLMNTLRNSLLSAHQNQRASSRDHAAYREFVWGFVQRGVADAEARIANHVLVQLVV